MSAAKQWYVAVPVTAIVVSEQNAESSWKALQKAKEAIRVGVCTKCNCLVRGEANGIAEVEEIEYSGEAH